jgi:hypothetical protein
MSHHSADGRAIGACVLAAATWLACGPAPGGEASPPGRRVAGLPAVRVSDDGRGFVLAGTAARFRPWGFNYDHDDGGRLIEDYWQSNWQTVAEDFREMKALGANVVRLHLQLGKFMAGPKRPNARALAQLARLVALAEQTGLYLDITGLGCYHKRDVPKWYDALGEADRWDVQARFWEAVAKTCARSPAVFCYDLMNEPVLPGAKKKETDWLAGEFAGKHFVQRIALDLKGRTREQVAEAWVDKLVSAIRKHDDNRAVTVGVIPWALTFPGAKPLFYSRRVGRRLDFVSVHFYPEKGKTDKALKALAVYDVGKPIVVEETFPLKCSAKQLEAFMDGSRGLVAGWITFYWGKTPDELRRSGTIRDAILLQWLNVFSRRAHNETTRTDETWRAEATMYVSGKP